MRGKHTKNLKSTPQGTSANPLDQILIALSEDPEVAPASRQWAERLLDAEAKEGTAKAEETAPRK
jgi:hypothetical protein